MGCANPRYMDGLDARRGLNFMNINHLPCRSLVEPQSSRRRRALFLAHPWAQVSTPPLMTARFLAESGYKVDMFVAFSPALHGLGICVPELNHPAIRILPSDPNKAAVPARLSDGTLLPKEHWAAVELASKMRTIYSWVIGFDPGGLAQAAAAAEQCGVPYVYHSLEIEDQPGPAKDLERRLSQGALYTLTQDEQRADILAHLNRIPRSSIYVSTNSSMGASLAEKDRFFKDLFPIGDRITVIATGTLLPITCVDTILTSTARWPKDFVLVLHGWIPDPNFRADVEKYIALSDNVFLSTKILPPHDKFRIFQGADIGLVFFNPTNHNLKFAAGSAGKLYDFMRCGVPIIGNDIPGMSALVAESGCGLVIPDASALPQALPLVAKRHAMFRQNCLQTFPKHEFSRSYAPILRMTQRLLEGKV